MAEWQPNPQELQQLVLLLQQSQSNSNEVQQEIYKKLDQFAQVPDYSNYLVVIFSKYDHEGTRIKAAILLKNNILLHYKNFNISTQNFIKNVTMQAIGDSSVDIRKHAAVILSSTAKAIGLEQWQEILSILFSLLDSPDPNLLDGSLRTLTEISEDYGYHLTRNPVYEKFTDSLVPKLINFYLHPNPFIRKYAITCLYKLTRYNANILKVHFPQLVINSIQISKDQDPTIRKAICSIFGVVVSTSKEIILNHLQDILKLLVVMLNDIDSTVVLEASDFWVQILDQRDSSRYVEIIYPFLPELVPILLKNLIFSEEERISMEADEMQRNATVDQQKDVKPRTFSSSTKTFDDYEGDDEYDDDEDDEDDGEFGDEDPQDWTVRKGSGCALDYLAGLLGENLLPIFLPEIRKIMDIQNAPWYVSESVILALGAVADGCSRGLIQYLPQLVPYLIINLSHPVSFIRRITCWTVSRYCHWIVRQPHQTYFLPVLENLLRLMLDPSKLVQQASISALSSILEDTGVNVLPYISPILTTLNKAFAIYQLNNLLLLYDAIGTICDTNKDMKKDAGVVGMFCNLIMPNLLEKWRVTEDTDKTICTLCECLTSVAIALGIGFQPYAESVFQRCLSIIDRYIALSAVEDCGSSENDFIICPLDLLSGISEGLGASVESLVSSSNILGILFHCAKQPYGDIRQVTYSLIGDLSKSSVLHMDKALVPFAEEMLREDPNQNGPATNNASWAIGELVYNGKEKLLPILPNILDWLIKIINSMKLKKSLLENTAVSLGRVCFVFPEFAATRFQEFASNWSYALIYLRPSKEKECAYRGLCFVITKNPAAVFNNNLIMIFRSFANYGEVPPADLGNMFQQIIDHFKQQAPPEHWAEFIAQLKDSADILQKLYKIRD